MKPLFPLSLSPDRSITLPSRHVASRPTSGQAWLRPLAGVFHVDELKQVLVFLDQESAKFNTVIIEAQRAVDLLQEHRTALTSAAVTGQIDLRGSGALSA